MLNSLITCFYPSTISGKCKEECLFNAVCLVEQLNDRCSCDPIQCDGTYKPLCGKDGHSYTNDCMRRKAECLSKTLIPIRHPGPCGEWRWRRGKRGGGGLHQHWRCSLSQSLFVFLRLYLMYTLSVFLLLYRLGSLCLLRSVWNGDDLWGGWGGGW